MYNSSEKLLCKLYEMTFEHKDKTSKTTCCLDSTVLKHNGHLYITLIPTFVFLMICERWNVLIFTFLFPDFPRINRNIITKNQHWGYTSKTKCCLNSTLLNHSGHSLQHPTENELIDPHLFLQMTCDMSYSYDIHSFVYQSFLSKNHK